MVKRLSKKLKLKTRANSNADKLLFFVVPCHLDHRRRLLGMIRSPFTSDRCQAKQKENETNLKTHKLFDKKPKPAVVVVVVVVAVPVPAEPSRDPSLAPAEHGFLSQYVLILAQNMHLLFWISIHTNICWCVLILIVH